MSSTTAAAETLRYRGVVPDERHRTNPYWYELLELCREDPIRRGPVEEVELPPRRGHGSPPMERRSVDRAKLVGG